MTIESIKRRYLSYLLRLWQLIEGGKPAWHASLENPLTGERQGFPSVEAMITFLYEQMQQPAQEAEPGPEGSSHK
jgi:hypothetical protein